SRVYPLVVVDNDRGVAAAVEVEERPDLLLQPGGEGRHLLLGIERALPRLAGGIAAQSVAPPAQPHRPMPGQLAAPQVQQWHQAAHMEAVGGGIETDVDGAR